MCVFSQNPFPVKLPHSKSGFLEFRRYYEAESLVTLHGAGFMEMRSSFKR